MYIATSFTAALAAFIVLQTFHSSHSPPPIRGRPCICVLATEYAICPEPMTLRESGCDDAVRVKVAPEAFMDSGEVAKLERGELAKPGRRTEEQARGSVAAKSDASLELGAFIGSGRGGTTTPGVTATASASGTIYIDAQSWVNMLTAMIVFAAAFGIMMTYQCVVIIKHVVQRRKSRHAHHTSIAATDDAVAAVPGGGHHGRGGLGGGFGGGGGGFGGGGFGGGGFGGRGRGGFGGGGRGGCGGRGGDKRYGDDDGHGGAAARIRRASPTAPLAEISETDEPYEVEASTESEAELERAEQERRGKSTVLSDIFSRHLLGIRVPSHPDYELLRKLVQRKRRFYGQEDMPEKPKQPRRRASFAGSFSDFMQSPDVGKTLAELTSTTNGAIEGGNPFAGQPSSSSVTNPFFAGEQSSSATNPFFVAPDVGQRTQEQPSAAGESISGAAARIADNSAVDERIVNVHLEHSRARKALEEKEQQLDGVRKSLAKAQAAESFCNLF